MTRVISTNCVYYIKISDILKTIFREEAIDTLVMTCNILLLLLILLTVEGERQGSKSRSQYPLIPFPARFSLALASRLL